LIRRGTSAQRDALKGHGFKAPALCAVDLKLETNRGICEREGNSSLGLFCTFQRSDYVDGQW
jgi:hypothetical protein